MAVYPEQIPQYLIDANKFNPNPEYVVVLRKYNISNRMGSEISKMSSRELSDYLSKSIMYKQEGELLTFHKTEFNSITFPKSVVRSEFIEYYVPYMYPQ